LAGETTQDEDELPDHWGGWINNPSKLWLSRTPYGDRVNGKPGEQSCYYFTTKDNSIAGCDHKPLIPCLRLPQPAALTVVVQLDRELLLSTHVEK
jgi:hypothetical protein